MAFHFQDTRKEFTVIQEKTFGLSIICTGVGNNKKTKYHH